MRIPVDRVPLEVFGVAKRVLGYPAGGWGTPQKIVVPLNSWGIPKKVWGTPKNLGGTPKI